MAKLKLATVWLAGCSGCHMSFLDIDELLIDLAARVELVYSPFMDVKDYPEGVDLVLVEGAVANEDNLHMIRTVRQRTRMLVSFGDCAVTGNVTALRNPLGLSLEVLQPVYGSKGDLHARIPDQKELIPVLLDRVQPVHQVVAVDFYLQGCPPPAGRIWAVLEALLQGKRPEVAGTERRFG